MMKTAKMKRLDRRSALKAALVSGVVAGLFAFGPAAHAAINFTFDYGLDTGTGFWDAADGQTRRNAMADASTAFGAMFATHFTNSATIILSATATNAPTSSNLASASSRLFTTGTEGFTVTEVVRLKALGVPVDTGGGVDGFVNVNFGQPWYYGGNAAATPSDQYDFYSTIFHEFTHALGFASVIEKDGKGLDGNQWATFDQFLVDKDGNKVIDPSTFALNQATWQTASIGGASPAGGLFFNGANAVAANNGQLVGLFTPNPYRDGSSVSHLDDDNPALFGTMMTAEGPTGPWPRTYGAVEVGIMRDLGYTAVAAVPEPETYAMLLLGLGVVGCMARRRRQS